MSLYEDLRIHQHAPADQKLKILREELLRPILTVETSAHLLQQCAREIGPCLPESIDPVELGNTLNWLSEAASDLRQILDALTKEADVPPPHVGD